MTRSCKFSFCAISFLAAAIIAAGVFSVPASAASSPSNISLLALQDLGDNDQDGIANYLDPDDDNDGVVDDLDYAPFDPLIQNPPAEAEPTPSPTPEPPKVPTEIVQPGQPEAPAKQPAEPPAVVTALPETGTGHGKHGVWLPLLTSVLLCTLATHVIEKRFNRH